MAFFGARWARVEAPDLEHEEGVKAAYNAHGAELYRFALRQLGDEGAAQDAVQETFLRAWRKADSYDSEIANLRVWLFAIVRNVVIDEVRRGQARPWQTVVEVDERAHRPMTSAKSDFEGDLLTSWTVEEALRRLSAEHRQAIVDVHLRGRPQDEVAAEHGIPVGTLRSRVFYGLKALRLALEEMGIEP